MSTPVVLSELQARLRDEALAYLHARALEPKVKKKVQRFDAEDEAGAHTETSLVLDFEHGGAKYELWLYAEEAGVMEPGDEWWSFGPEDFASADELVAAVLAHLKDIVEEGAAEGG